MTTTRPADPVEQRLCLALYRASHAMNGAYRGLLAPLGLTYPQYTVMSILWQQGTTGVNAIARRLGVESSTASPLLTRLEARGWIRRRRGEGDDRTVLVELTAAGRQLGERARDVPGRIAAATGMSAQEQAALVHQLDALAQTLGRDA